MKKVAAILLALIFGEVATVPFVVQQPPKITTGSDYEKIDKCDLCVQFSQQVINNLLNIVANAGVIRSCNELCELIVNKTHSGPFIGVACELLCDGVGLKEFIDAIEKADLDSIYYCELLNACPIKDDGDATITTLKVTPKMVPYGTKFTIDLEYKTMNGTGTGEISMFIQAADGLPLGQLVLIEPKDPGSYSRSWEALAEADPDCLDNSIGPCESWIPGLYVVHVAICNGECGSNHPHSQLYDKTTTTFNVTKPQF